jgi:hypothetical protein
VNCTDNAGRKKPISKVAPDHNSCRDGFGRQTQNPKEVREKATLFRVVQLWLKHGRSVVYRSSDYY